MIDYNQLLSEQIGMNPYLISQNVLDFFAECIDMTKLYAMKDHDYGDSFSKGMSTIGPAYGVGRLYDKMNRLINLTRTTTEVNDESLQDTVRDLACYAIMLNNYWYKQ